MNEPHAPAVPQVTVQSAPWVSLVRVTERLAVVLTAMLFGGAIVKTIVIAGGVMVTVALADFVVSAVEVAVIVTVIPAGTPPGAV